VIRSHNDTVQIYSYHRSYPMDGKPLRLRDQVHAVIRVNHYSNRTEKTYWYWIRYFIRFTR